MLIEIDREEDGRWIADIPELPGVMVYGATREEAISKVEALALHTLADRLEHGEKISPAILSRISKHTGLSPEDLR